MEYELTEISISRLPGGYEKPVFVPTLEGLLPVVKKNGFWWFYERTPEGGYITNALYGKHSRSGFVLMADDHFIADVLSRTIKPKVVNYLKGQAYNRIPANMTFYGRFQKSEAGTSWEFDLYI